MPLLTIEKCYRGRKDCKSFSVIEGGVPEGLTEEQERDLDFTPKSFVCCGCIAREARDPKQDAYRVCFKTEASDTITDNDEQDLVHLVAVITQALAVVVARRASRGHIDVPKDFEGSEMMSVNTRQGLERA